ncbi:MAG TPA: MFS transporter [Anaerolineales bacterium]|nr:MFS transporter [Anaerolineales bacterium]
MEKATAVTAEAGLQPTQFEKLRAIPWSLGYDLANTFFGQLTFFGSVFILFLNDLRLNESQIGLLLSALPFLSLLSLFISGPVAKLGYKKTFLLSMGARNLFTAGLILVPALAVRSDIEFVVGYVALVTVAFAISRAIAMTAFLPWQQEYIPDQIRGRYAGYSSITISLAGLVAVVIAGFLIDRPLGAWRYPLLFGIGIFFGVSSLYLASHLPGGVPSQGHAPSFRIDRAVFTPLRDLRFLRYLLILGLITLSIGPIFSFLPIFMREKVGLSSGNIVFLQTGGLIGSLLSSYFWGWLADRYGSRPISLTGLLMIITLPVLWYILPRESALSLPAALGISFFQGVANSGWGIGSGRLLFVSIVPSESKAEYLSQYNAWMGLLSGLGSILGGVLLQSFSSLQTTVFTLRIDSYSVLFGIGFFLSLIAALLLLSMSIARETRWREFAGLFFHGNPLMAISSMIRFYYAKEEADVVSVTERLGSTRSPLAVEELIGSLNDPRFYVRLEAIVAMSRHSANDRLVRALIEVMEAPDPALSTIAAWALGRIGNLKALPALRKSFTTSKYRSVQAQAARALGTLGDRKSIALLRKRLQSESDLGLRIACASGLGKLQVTRATPDLLNLLYISPDPHSRREVGLCLARLFGAEAKYVQLSRTLHEDPGTALAQEMESLRTALKKKTREKPDILLDLIEAREQFAQGELEGGFQPFLNIISSIPSEEIPLYYRQVFSECSNRITEFGRNRLEYVILAIIALEKCRK